MCNFLFVAADRPLAIWEWDANHPGLHTLTADDPTHPVRQWMDGTYLYDIDGPEGCGCVFEAPVYGPYVGVDKGEAKQARRKAFQQLARYLDEAVEQAGTVTLYNGWDWWEPPLARRSIRVSDVATRRFRFRERELLVVRR